MALGGSVDDLKAAAFVTDYTGFLCQSRQAGGRGGRGCSGDTIGTGRDRHRRIAFVSHTLGFDTVAQGDIGIITFDTAVYIIAMMTCAVPIGITAAVTGDKDWRVTPDLERNRHIL